MWLERRGAYTLSLAVMSMAGYILGAFFAGFVVLYIYIIYYIYEYLNVCIVYIYTPHTHTPTSTGLGDRHPSNLMLERASGRVVHIDFGDCFEVRTLGG